MLSGGTGDPKAALRSDREWTRGGLNSEEAQAGNAMRGGTHISRFVEGCEGFQLSA